ncbi:MAG: NERD domain-containing protein, partial [Solirubrobacterales bacterium]|nr:NERD domain-containing protein [Solirubrobacterales bacterium]
ARSGARSSGRSGAWLRASLKLAFIAVVGAPSPPGPIPPSDREQATAAGVRGEDSALAALCQRLGDDWRALSGYRNRGGEVDLLLLGPRGVFAVEIKNNSATIVCHGDHWFYEKYDKYNNLVDKGTIRDRNGRSPSQQLNEPADRLASTLVPHCPELWIERVVLLCHPRGWVDFRRSSKLTVAVANEVDHVLELIAQSDVRLTSDTVAQLQEAIVADHRRHNRRPAGRR